MSSPPETASLRYGVRMFIESLKLQNYRNYESLDLKLADGTNVLYGDNAQGKTNILEAIYLCALGRSHRGTKDRELIQFDRDEAHVRLGARKDGVPVRIDIHLKKGRGKGVAVNGMPLRRMSDLFGELHVVFFSPEDLSIVKNGPSERRKFLDMELCQLDPVYTYHLANYTKVVVQRNHLLKDLEEKPELMDTLDVWDSQLVRYGSEVIRRRREFTSQIAEIVGRTHAGISGGEESLRVSYEPNVTEEEFAEKLRRMRPRDLGARATLSGPHHDDLKFEIGGIDVRRFGSQGQQRTAALSLKLAEIELVKMRTGDSPVLLLDDVLSELDTKRQVHLLAEIRNVQTIVTCTGLDDFILKNLHIDRRFLVRAGNVAEISDTVIPGAGAAAGQERGS